MTSRQKLTKWKYVLALAATLVAAGLFGYSGLANSRDPSSLGDAANASAAAPRRLLVRVRVAKESGPERLTRTFTGVVQPRRTSAIASKSIGRVEHVRVDVGDQVQAGDLLVELDHHRLDASRQALAAQLAAAQFRLNELQSGPRRQEIEQAEARQREAAARLALAQQNLERATQLFASNSVSKQELDEQRFELDSANSQMDAAEEALDVMLEGTRSEQIAAQRATVDALSADLNRIDVDIAEQKILAPYAGSIQSRSIDEGAVVSPGTKLLTIVESSELEIQVGLPNDLARMLPDINCVGRTSDATINIELDRISPTVDQLTHTRRAVFWVANDSRSKVDLGEAISVDLHLPTSQTDSGESIYWLPTQALVSAARGLWAAYVAVPESIPANELALHKVSVQVDPNLSDCVIERRQVELLRTHGDWSQVRGPILPQELIVCEGVHRIVTGQHVSAVIEQ